MEQKYGIIYRAYDSKGMSYIGQSMKTLEERRKAHFSKINDGQIFHIALKYFDFQWEVLEDNIPEEQLLERERYWVQVFDSKNNGYNGKSINCFQNCRKPRSEETKKKISEHNVGMKGKHHSEETCKKISESNKGKLHGMKGQHHSDETKKKISKSLKGKHWKFVNGKRVLY